MKNVIALLVGLLLCIQFISCKKENNIQQSYNDGALTDAVWKLEKMTTADGTIIPNPDKGTVFENAQIFIEFNSDKTINFTFSGLPGTGSYEIGNGNTMSIGKNYSITSEIGFESKYYDLHVNSIRSVTHYYVNDETLQLLYGNDKSIIHLKKH